MGKQNSKPLAGKPPRPQRTVVVSDGVRVVMAGLSQAEKDKIESAFRSAAAIRRLPVDRIVEAPGGDMYAACVTDDLRLIYQIKPDRIEVVLLLSAGAAENLAKPVATSGSNGTPKP